MFLELINSSTGNEITVNINSVVSIYRNAKETTTIKYNISEEIETNTPYETLKNIIGNFSTIKDATGNEL